MVRLDSKKAPPLQGFFNQSITKTQAVCLNFANIAQ